MKTSEALQLVRQLQAKKQLTEDEWFVFQLARLILIGRVASLYFP